MTYYFQRNYGRARFELEKLINELELDYSKCYVNMMIGRCYLEEGNYQKAEVYYKKALPYYYKISHYSGPHPLYSLKILYKKVRMAEQFVSEIDIDNKLKEIEDLINSINRTN